VFTVAVTFHMTTVQEPLTGPSFPSFFKSVIDDLTKIVIPSKHSERGAHSALRTPWRRISPKTSPQDNVELPGVKKSRPPVKKDKKEVELGCGAPALPELEALCGDLTTATNINRAVAQVFLLLAQGRISRRDALAFGSLARLLLRTVPAIRSEFVSAFGYAAWEAELKPKLTMRPASSSPPPAKVYQQDELSPVNKVNVSEGSLSDRRTVIEPPAQQDRPSPTAVQRVKEPVLAPALNSQLPAPTSPPAQPALVANVAPPPKVMIRPGSSSRANTVSEGPLRSPALCHPAAPSDMPGKPHQGTPPGIPDTRAADSVPNSESVPNKIPSPAASPAAAVPGIAGPRLLWVERFQRFIPESAL
jgi:hypothetical protein